MHLHLFCMLKTIDSNVFFIGAFNSANSNENDDNNKVHTTQATRSMNKTNSNRKIYYKIKTNSFETKQKAKHHSLFIFAYFSSTNFSKHMHRHTTYRSMEDI